MTRTAARALAATLRERHVAMIALGGVVGAGLFVGSGVAILAAGPAVLLSYAAAGAIAFLVMRMLGEMALARPATGSFVAHIRAGLGPAAAFVAGWLYWYFWIIAVGAETIAGASLLHDWIALPVWAIGVALIAMLTATNLMSVRAYGEFEFWFSMIKVAAILGFVAGVALHLVFGRTDAVATLAAAGGFAPHGASAILGAIPLVMFSLTGSEIASIAAAESDDPAGNVARAARRVALRITLFYLLAIGLIVATVPASRLVAGQSPFVAALRVIGIPAAATLMQAIILVAVLSCLNSGIYVTSRCLFELADAGDAPRGLVVTGSRQVPTRAILVAGAAGLVAAFASVLSPGRVFAFLLQTSGAVILVVYLLIALTQIAQRRRRAHAAEPTDFAVPWFPWLSYATVLGIVVVFAAMAVRSDQRAVALSSGASVAVAFAAALVRGRRADRDPTRRSAAAPLRDAREDA